MTLPVTFAAPFAAIDHMVLEEEGGLRCTRTLLAEDPFFVGHYPDYPIFPGVFILETVHQAVRHTLSQQSPPPCPYA